MGGNDRNRRVRPTGRILANMNFLTCPSGPPRTVSLRQPSSFCFPTRSIARDPAHESASRIRELSRNQNARRQRRETDQVLGERICTFRENFRFETPRGFAKGKVLRCAQDDSGSGRPAITREARESREESPERPPGVRLEPILARRQKFLAAVAVPPGRRVSHASRRAGTRQYRTHESHETQEDWPRIQARQRFRPILRRSVFCFAVQPRKPRTCSIASASPTRSTLTPAGKAPSRRLGRRESSMTNTPRSSARRIRRP